MASAEFNSCYVYSVRASGFPVGISWSVVKVYALNRVGSVCGEHVPTFKHSAGEGVYLCVCALSICHTTRTHTYDTLGSHFIRDTCSAASSCKHLISQSSGSRAMLKSLVLHWMLTSNNKMRKIAIFHCTMILGGSLSKTGRKHPVNTLQEIDYAALGWWFKRLQ